MGKVICKKDDPRAKEQPAGQKRQLHYNTLISESQEIERELFDMSQKKEILDWMKEKKSITALEAVRACNCMRLAARISDLRREGYRIRTQLVTENGKTFARYYLVEGKS